MQTSNKPVLQSCASTYKQFVWRATRPVHTADCMNEWKYCLKCIIKTDMFILYFKKNLHSFIESAMFTGRVTRQTNRLYGQRMIVKLAYIKTKVFSFNVLILIKCICLLLLFILLPYYWYYLEHIRVFDLCVKTVIITVIAINIINNITIIMCMYHMQMLLF